jgi:TM2 domain-containing membrane protein YozV
MSQDKYRVTFKGEIQEGVSPEEVKTKLAKILKLSDEKAAKLFSGKPIIIKKNASKQTCIKIQNALKKAGAKCKVKKEAPTPEEEPEFKIDGFQPTGTASVKLQKQPEVLPGIPATKTTVILLALFFGIFGMHKFYTSRNKMGYLYVILSWTLVPIIFSLLDILFYLLIKKEKFEKKFRVIGNQKHMMLGLLLALSLIGTEVYLGITIGIPKYIEYRDKRFHIAVDHELHYFRVRQEVYMIDNKRYASSLKEMDYKPKYPDIRMTLIESSPQCYKAEGKHPQLNYPRTIDCHGNIEDGFVLLE